MLRGDERHRGLGLSDFENSPKFLEKLPGKMVPGMGRAMDLVTGTKRAIVAMTHSAKGESKIVKRCHLPLTSIRRVDLVVTDLVVLVPTDDGLVFSELAPGVTIE